MLFLFQFVYCEYNVSIGGFDLSLDVDITSNGTVSMILTLPDDDLFYQLNNTKHDLWMTQPDQLNFFSSSPFYFNTSRRGMCDNWIHIARTLVLNPIHFSELFNLCKDYDGLAIFDYQNQIYTTSIVILASTLPNDNITSISEIIFYAQFFVSIHIKNETVISTIISANPMDISINSSFPILISQCVNGSQQSEITLYTTTVAYNSIGMALDWQGSTLEVDTIGATLTLMNDNTPSSLPGDGSIAWCTYYDSSITQTICVQKWQWHTFSPLQTMNSVKAKWNSIVEINNLNSYAISIELTETQITVSDLCLNVSSICFYDAQLTIPVESCVSPGCDIWCILPHGSTNLGSVCVANARYENIFGNCLTLSGHITKEIQYELIGNGVPVLINSQQYIIVRIRPVSLPNLPFQLLDNAFISYFNDSVILDICCKDNWDLFTQNCQDLCVCTREFDALETTNWNSFQFRIAKILLIGTIFLVTFLIIYYIRYLL